MYTKEVCVNRVELGAGEVLGASEADGEIESCALNEGTSDIDGRVDDVTRGNVPLMGNTVSTEKACVGGTAIELAASETEGEFEGCALTEGINAMGVTLTEGFKDERNGEIDSRGELDGSDDNLMSALSKGVTDGFVDGAKLTEGTLGDNLTLNGSAVSTKELCVNRVVVGAIEVLGASEDNGDFEGLTLLEGISEIVGWLDGVLSSKEV